MRDAKGFGIKQWVVCVPTRERGNEGKNRSWQGMKTLWMIILALKYWLRGGPWDLALEYARFLVFGFRKDKDDGQR